MLNKGYVFNRFGHKENMCKRNMLKIDLQMWTMVEKINFWMDILCMQKKGHNIIECKIGRKISGLQQGPTYFSCKMYAHMLCYVERRVWNPLFQKSETKLRVVSCCSFSNMSKTIPMGLGKTFSSNKFHM